MQYVLGHFWSLMVCFVWFFVYSAKICHIFTIFCHSYDLEIFVFVDSKMSLIRRLVVWWEGRKFVSFYHGEVSRIVAFIFRCIVIFFVIRRCLEVKIFILKRLANSLKRLRRLKNLKRLGKFWKIRNVWKNFVRFRKIHKIWKNCENSEIFQNIPKLMSVFLKLIIHTLTYLLQGPR